MDKQKLKVLINTNESQIKIRWENMLFIIAMGKYKLTIKFMHIFCHKVIFYQ